MALRDMIAAASSKANSLASAASSKANSAIETGKLNLKINSEEKKIAEFTQNIGALVLDKLDAGETCDDEIMALYDSILASRTTINEARAEIDTIRRAAEPTCPSCGAPLAESANFCANCGTKIEKPVEVEVIEADSVCTAPDCDAEPDDSVTPQCSTPEEAPTCCTGTEEAPASPCCSTEEPKAAERSAQ